MMHDAVLRALGAFKEERNGDNPTSLRLHPADWDRLRADMKFASHYGGTPKPTVYGMIPLLDHKWPEGFPLAMDASGAASAIEAGAFQA